MIRPIFRRFSLLTSALLAVSIFCSLNAEAAPPRAIVHGHEEPPGVTVLDRRGDQWLVTGTSSQLSALPGAQLLGEMPDAAPTRTFSPVYSPLIDDLVSQVGADQLIADVEWLVGLGVRFSQVPNIHVVADSLEAKLASFGLETEKHYFPMGSLSVPNVIATKTGVVEPDSVFVFCAHYDAISESPQYNTPGADDNGTGTVALLTAARLLANLQTDYTVKFVLFAGEEQGLVGSQHWVSDMAQAGLPIVGALNYDMMGWWEPGVPFDLEIETNTSSRWLADAVCWAADTYTTMSYILHEDNSIWWGDFYSFWQHGYAAVSHEESWDWYDPDFNPNYHSTNDTVENLSPEFFEGSARIGVAALASLAGVSQVSAVPEPALVMADLNARPNPFNGRVVLSLAAPGVDGPQALSIFDLRGHRVDEVILNMVGGQGRIQWDARDESGRTVPGGVYLAMAEGLPGRPSCRVVFVP